MYQPNEQNAKPDANEDDFTFANYVAYVLYPPLYLAGPILTFSAFMDQIKRKSSISFKAIFAYTVRFVACLLTMEVLLHYIYVVAIKDAAVVQADGSTVRAWTGDTPAELGIISFWNLIVVWLKVRMACLLG